jgi:hydrogenase-4 component B
MLNIVILFTILIVAVGVASMVMPAASWGRKHLASTVIAASGLSVLGYLIWIFPRIDADSITTLMNWQLPFAGMPAGIDPLSAFFLIPLLILTVSCAIYGPHYFHTHKAPQSHWLFYSLLIAGMVMVLLARNAVMFLMAWEIMSIASFFLVITDTKSSASIRAGWIYFITAHIGTAFLLMLFFLLSSSAGSFDFVAWQALRLSVGKADAVFILALIAFGMKAGVVPFHFWLPLAYPAAPSHVSATMSGIMSKMGIYGLLRMLTFIMPYHSWWGILLIALGGVSGVLGILFASGQSDIKRLLAFSSVENAGIILLGVGIGIAGAAAGSNTIALFGFAGALLHIINHSLFKGLLFLGAGAVIRQTGSGDIDRLGGLIKKMPRTGLLFLIGAMAISGLPFLNGFIGELLIYAAGITGAIQMTGVMLPMVSLAVLVSLALIGGLAAACFVKLFGVVFLGEPRSAVAQASSDVPAAMLWAMGFCAGLCVVIGLGSFAIVPFLIRPALLFVTAATAADTHTLTSLTNTVSLILGSIILIGVTIAGLMKLSGGKKRAVTAGVTWDCGYSAPAPTMQYTASSFVSPIITHFKLALAATEKLSTDKELFPEKPWHFSSGVDDWFLTRVFEPAIRAIDQAFLSLHWFQNGKTGQYIFYIALAIFCLIVWKFFL